MCIKISVVIPTFKRPQLLLKCLSALKNQSFSPENYEVIVVTDGPDDETRQNVKSFTNQHHLLNFICNNLNIKAGPAAARNKGASLAKGELIVFTDDDCVPDNNWLQSYWNAFCKEQQKEIAFSGKTVVPRSGKLTDYEKNIANLETAEFITANCACTKQAFKKVNGFDEDFEIAWREDSELQFKFITASVPIIKINEALVVHPVRDAPWAISLKEQKKSKFNALLHKKHPLLYKEKIGIKPLWNYYAMVVLLPICILSYIKTLPVIFAISFSCWLFLVVQFIVKRLKGTSKNLNHIIEIIFTSVLIPFLSVFWNLYGSARYKKLVL